MHALVVRDSIAGRRRDRRTGRARHLALVETGLLATPKPRNEREEYWRGDHPEFGVWHAPGLTYKHRSPCYEVEYRANSVGARDVERSLRSERPRVVVLGDSFIEGWGVAEPERLSNVLEAKTGIEHLNFAMAHFGPYQSYLVYRSLATRFDHEALIVGDPPDLHHQYHREPFWRRWLRHRSYAVTALITAGEGRARERAAAAMKAQGERAWFYDYEERQARLLEEILERLAREARGKRVAVVLVPSLTDLHQHDRMGPDSLSARLSATGERSGYRVVNLLPSMAAHTKRWPRYFLPCDYHWSAYGNEVAARYLRRALGPDFFERGSH